MADLHPQTPPDALTLEDAYALLIRYGNHDPECRTDYTRMCFCGYSKVVHELAQTLGLIAPGAV